MEEPLETSPSCDLHGSSSHDSGKSTELAVHVLLEKPKNLEKRDRQSTNILRLVLVKHNVNYSLLSSL